MVGIPTTGFILVGIFMVILTLSTEPYSPLTTIVFPVSDCLDISAPCGQARMKEWSVGHWFSSYWFLLTDGILSRAQWRHTKHWFSVSPQAFHPTNYAELRPPRMSDLPVRLQPVPSLVAPAAAKFWVQHSSCAWQGTLQIATLVEINFSSGTPRWMGKVPVCWVWTRAKL